MKNMYDPSTVQEVRMRIERLRPDSPSAWGKMNVAQMLAHCSAWTEMAAGLNSPPRAFLGRIFGRWAKAAILGEKPIGRNVPTDKSLIVNDERRFKEEQLRLLSWTDRFAAAGPERCTRHPHCFFGPMTPDEWAIMGYKHLDHHLRQFGA